MFDILNKLILLFEVKLSRTLGVSPRSIPFPVLWITNKCNLKCKMCDQWKTDPSLFSKELSAKEWFKLIDSLKRLGAVTLVITGGEPFLRPDLFEILEYIQKNHLSVHICTNGTLLNLEKIDKLKKLKPLSISVSLDSYEEETHNSIRGADCFKPVVEGVKLLKHHIPTINLGINCTLSRKNFYNIHKMVDFAQELKADQLKIDLINTELKHRNITAEDSRELTFRESDMNEVESEIDRYIQAVKKTKLLTNSITFLKGIKNLRRVRRSLACYAGYAFCAIDPLGNVSVCDKFAGSDNIRDKSFESIWRSESFQKQRKSVSNCKTRCWDSTHAEVNIRYDLKSFLKEFSSISREFSYYL